jgi:cephalosporin hydroxylase
MSKTVTSPVKKFPGTVRISEPLTYPQCFAIEDALAAHNELDSKATARRRQHVLLPGIMACIEEWNIEGIPDDLHVDNFPATPTNAIDELVAWLLDEIVSVYRDDEDPNE